MKHAIGPNDDRIRALIDDPPRTMTEREYDFLEDMLGRLMLSEKQQDWLDAIFAKFEK